MPPKRTSRKAAPKSNKTRQHKKAQTAPLVPVEPLQSIARLTLNQQRFLTSFAICGNVTHAAELSGLHRSNHYAWLESDPTYVEAFKEASEVAVDRLIEEARRRAMAGSDVLLIFLLKGLRPETFRDNHSLTLRGKLDHEAKLSTTTTKPKELTNDERANRIKQLLDTAGRRRATSVPHAAGANGTGPLADGQDVLP